jgi:hypothetical protein
MKHSYTLLTFMLTSTLLQGQILQTENFESASYGRITESPKGHIYGPTGYKNLSIDVLSQHGDIDGFLIDVIDQEHSNSYVSNVTCTQQSFSYTWKDGLIQSWNERTPGNNILKVTFDLYTGEMTQGTGNAIYVVYDSTIKKILAGISYNYENGALVGYYHYFSPWDNETKDRGIGLGNELYPTNTWLTVSLEYNMETGSVAWNTPEGVFTPWPEESPGTSGEAPFQGVYYSWVIPNTPGVETHQNSAYDNVIIEAKSTSLLSEQTPEIDSQANVKIYPNPTSDYLKILSNEKIEKIQIFDLLGRNMNAKLIEDQINVQSLSKGNYILTVVTETGKKENIKFIRK